MVTLKLYAINFESAMLHHQGLYIIRSDSQPTRKECEDALNSILYNSDIIANYVSEVLLDDIVNSNELITIFSKA